MISSPRQCWHFIIIASRSFTTRLTSRSRSRSWWRLRSWARLGSWLRQRIASFSIAVSRMAPVTRFRSRSWFWYAARGWTPRSFQMRAWSRPRTRKWTGSRSADTSTTRSWFTSRSWSSRATSCTRSCIFPRSRACSSRSKIKQIKYYTEAMHFVGYLCL